MKKLITLLLVLTGMVSTADAKDLYLLISRSGWWSDGNIVTEISFDDGANYSDMTQIHMYGQRWNKCTIPSSYTTVKVKRHSGENHWNETEFNSSLLSGDGDKYVEVTTDGGVTFTTIDAPSWANLTFRQNIVDWKGDNGNTWDATDNNYTTKSDGTTFTFVLTKAQIDASSNKASGICFKLRNGDYIKYNDSGDWVDGYPQIYPGSVDEGNAKSLSIAGSTTSYYHNTTSTEWFWQIAIPSYDYEKIVITAKYIYDSGYKWKISADAYVTKTVSGTNQYATLGCSVPLEIIEANDVVAYPLTANASTGKITKGTAITTIPAGEGALLENTTGSDKTIRAQVLASAAASASNNLVATTGTTVAKVTETGYTNYILANQNDHVGFYMVNTSGNTMGANTAYLHVANAGGARAFFFDDDVTAINAVKQEQEMNGEYFNLAGQRVAQPTKGLYIVNGKKVIIK